MEHNGEKTDQPMETESSSRSDYYDRYLGEGYSDAVADKLDQITQKGALDVESLDPKATDSLKALKDSVACQVLQCFIDDDLSHVKNKSAFLTGRMRQFREKSESVPVPKQEEKLPGPDDEKIKEILVRTSYGLEVTPGQRKYGPAPDFVGDPPGHGNLHIGKLPRDVFEDELIPLFEPFGKIYDLRLMMDSTSGYNKGFGFIQFCDSASAKRAVEKMNGYSLKGRNLTATISVPNNKLFVGKFPASAKNKNKEQLLEVFKNCENLEGVRDVIVYFTAEDKTRNRGFCFVEFGTHQLASAAKKSLEKCRAKPFENHQITVDWADAIDEPDEETMARVKIVYVNQLALKTTEAQLQEAFKCFGDIEKAKKVKDYAFIHFKDREHALTAIQEMHKTIIDDCEIECSLAKPASEGAKKKKQLRMEQRNTYDYNYDYGNSTYQDYGYGGRGDGRFGGGYSDDLYLYGSYTGGYEDNYGSYGGNGGGYGYGYGGEYDYNRDYNFRSPAMTSPRGNVRGRMLPRGMVQRGAPPGRMGRPAPRGAPRPMMPPRGGSGYASGYGPPRGAPRGMVKFRSAPSMDPRGARAGMKRKAPVAPGFAKKKYGSHEDFASDSYEVWAN